MTQTQPHLTHWKKLNNPNYLGSYALQPGQDLIVTIKSAGQETIVGNDGRKEDKLVIHFTDNNLKPMILNATNCKTITQVTGTPYIEQWAGQAIQLFTAKVNAFNVEVDALRVRPFKPQLRETLTPNHKFWTQAVQKLRDNETSIEKIRQFMDVTDDVAAMLIHEATNTNENQEVANNA